MEDIFGNNGTDWGALMAEYGIKIGTGILILVVGLWIAGMITNTVKNLMKKQNYDPALQSFLGSLIRMALKVLVVISALGNIGY